MIDTLTASQLISEHTLNPAIIKVPLEKAVGRVLQQDITADMDFPPFDRVMMDGIAIRYDDLKEGCVEFEIGGMQPAGAPQIKLSDEYGQCVEVMTGAILPENADTVLPYEWIEIKRGKAMIKNDGAVKGRNVHCRGIDNKKGEVLISKGEKISAAEIAVMATVGMKEVSVSQQPRIALISTGDELVEIDQKPAPHQIRKSNVYALAAELKTIGMKCGLYHLADEKSTMSQAMEKILKEHEVVILTGGVSKGKFDYVPEVLESLGVQKIFHRVKQKPGKPLWFGHSKQNVVFALPGNPVSVFMCFHKYFLPWLRLSLGIKESYKYQAVLAEDFDFSGDLTYFLQVNVKMIDGKLIAYPQKGKGSGDLANLTHASGFLELSANKSTFKAGEVYPYVPFRIR